jgi:hypothetical protein
MPYRLAVAWTLHGVEPIAVATSAGEWSGAILRSVAIASAVKTFLRVMRRTVQAG